MGRELLLMSAFACFASGMFTLGALTGWWMRYQGQQRKEARERAQREAMLQQAMANGDGEIARLAAQMSAASADAGVVALIAYDTHLRMLVHGLEPLEVQKACCIGIYQAQRLMGATSTIRASV